MRYVERDRIEPPAVFGSDDARISRQRVLNLFMSGPETLLQTRSDRSRSIADHPEVRRALADLFNHSCAFCETLIDDPKVFRFRPAEGAHPVTDRDFAHLYYAWLADAWQNLYPICWECMPEDPFYFPVADRRRSPIPNPGQLSEYIDRGDGRWPFYPLDEKTIFLDPCNDRDLWRHLRFWSDGSIGAYSNSRRGRATIRQFRLDRRSLREERVVMFERYFAQLWEGLETEDYDDGRSLFPHRGPFSGGWRIYLRDLLARALNRRASENVERQLLVLREHRDWRDRLERARDALVAPPEPEEAWNSERLYYEPSAPREPRRIVIRNFKSLENIEVRLPAPSTSGEPNAAALLILGENAAGKSTILEAIAIALMDTKTRHMLDLKAGQLVLNPRYLGARGAHSPEQAEVELHYAEGEKQHLSIAPSALASSDHFIEQDFRTQGEPNSIPLFAYGAFRQYLDAQRRYTKHKHVRSMFQTDQLLSNPERWLLGLKRAEFNMAVRAMRDVFSIDGEFDVLERRDDRVFVVQKLGDGEAGPLQHTPLTIVSSGFRAVLAMLCDIMQGLMDKRVNPEFSTLETARGIVLIDEIEAHLHPRWKMAIMTGLRRALPQVTFIATSHDPLCLRGMKPGEVLVLERIPGAQADTELPVFTQSLVDLPDNSHWTIEQLLTADFFQLRSTENADAERRLARMQDKLALGVTPAEDPELQAYLNEISGALPIGDSEVHRLVQEAVAMFLAEQRTATRERLKGLKEETRQAIVEALRSAT